MTITAAAVAPPDALAALAGAIAAAKSDDALAPVVVVVPTNTCGVMARRALGRAGGIVGVDFVTLNRLAELIAGPELAANGRSPMSTPVVDLTIEAVLRRDPGPFRPVASHPSTIVALRELHHELRLAGPAAAQRLAAASSRGREAVRVSTAVADALAARWYDEADLYARAATAAGAGNQGGVRALVLHLPQDLSGLALAFVRAVAETAPVQLVVQRTGDALADQDAADILTALGIPAPATDTSATDTSALATTPATSTAAHRTIPNAPSPTAVISATDADDEVRIAVRRIVDAAREGVPLERMTILWPNQRPYARLVEHHLDVAGLPWNGRPGTTTTERLAPRLVLDLLDVDRRGLRRRSLFELLADVPARDHDGRYLPTAEWERVSREAGVARDDDWNRRLRSLAGDQRWSAPAATLQTFVGELRDQLGHPSATRRWKEWATWCHDQLETWLGRHSLERLPDPEYRAWEELTRALDRLSHLDPVGDPVTRHQFRTTLEAELDASPGRHGRVGDGITVGPLAGAVGLDIDVAIVLGAADGMLPPTPSSDPLLADSDRDAADLATSDALTIRLRRLFLAAIASSDVTITYPRGDLRATSTLLPSRWIGEWTTGAPTVDVVDVDSHHAGLESTPFPASDAEHRLRRRYHHVHAGGDVLDSLGADRDVVLRRGVALVRARASDSLTVYDGDLSGAEVPPVRGPVSPSRLERWTACPHAYFVRYLLRAAPIDEPDDGISITARDRGSAQHDALDRFHRAVIDGRLPQPSATGWSDEHRLALGGFFDEVCARTEGRGRTGRPAYWADERERMRADLIDWLTHDSALAASRGATVLASEQRFGGHDITLALVDGRRVAIEGTIDRVDRTADGTLVVTDHKTGRNTFRQLSADDPTLGASLFQLPSYAAAARALFGDDTPVRAEYGLLRKGDYERPGVVLTDEVVARVGEQLTLVVDGIESGFFPNRPQRPGWRMFVECEYCEPDHLGTAERWAEWERKQHDPRLARWFGATTDPTASTAVDMEDRS